MITQEHLDRACIEAFEAAKQGMRIRVKPLPAATASQGQTVIIAVEYWIETTPGIWEKV